jgi:hypothetical protein
MSFDCQIYAGQCGDKVSDASGYTWALIDRDSLCLRGDLFNSLHANRYASPRRDDASDVERWRKTSVSVPRTLPEPFLLRDSGSSRVLGLNRTDDLSRPTTVVHVRCAAIGTELQYYRYGKYRSSI